MSTFLQLDIGRLIDVYSVDDKQWYSATIIDCDVNEIKVHYDCDSDTELDEWLDVNNPHDVGTKIAPIHSKTLDCIPLPIPSQKVVISNNQSKCIYNASDESILLIALNTNVSGSKSIYKYDIMRNAWSTFGHYTSLTSSINSITINHEQSLLYIFGTGFNNYCPILDTFDIHKQRLKSSKKVDCMKCCNVFDPHLCCVPSPLNELHLLSTINFQNASHFRVDGNSVITTLCSRLEFEAVFVTFCKETKQLIAINNFGSIYLCNLDIDVNRSLYEWNPLQIGIDIEIDACFAFLAYDHFLFMFVLVYNECEERQMYEIWFVDLVEHKVFKSHKKAPELLFEYSFLGTMDVRNNALHIVIGDDDESMQHFKLCLVDIIPQQMFEFYQQKYHKKVVFGYIEQMTLSSSIPVDIMHLLLAFYPPFLK
eukprot:189261_1